MTWSDVVAACFARPHSEIDITMEFIQSFVVSTFADDILV